MPVTGSDSGASFEDETAASAGASRRGRLVVQRRVVERIASQAAAESGDTGGVSGGLLGIGSQGDLAARPEAGVELVGQSATVSLDLTVAYPSPIHAVTDQVRAHIVSRVRELSGVEVTRVDITVTALQRPNASAPKVA